MMMMMMVAAGFDIITEEFVSGYDASKPENGPFFHNPCLVGHSEIIPPIDVT
jgi:hypothetical protein